MDSTSEILTNNPKLLKESKADNTRINAKQASSEIGSLTTNKSPELTRKQEIRDFTRSTEDGRQQRTDTSRAILDERKQLRGIRDEVRSLIEARESRLLDIKAQQELIQKSEEKIELQRKELRAREVSLVKRTLDFFRPTVLNTVKNELTQTENTVQYTKNELEEQYKQMKIMYDELQRLMYERERLPDGTQILSDFYRNAGIEMDMVRKKDALEEYKDKFGTVEKISTSDDVYFIHATHPGIKKGQNNPLINDGTTWEKKIAVIAEYKPTLSVSTVTKQGCDQLWSDIGVILNSGRIEEVSATDSGTKVISIKERVTGLNTSHDIQSYATNIHRHSTRTRYNEFILGGDPQIAGIFINLDSRQQPNAEEKQSIVYWTTNGSVEEIQFQEIIDQANLYGLDVFGLKNGRAHKMELDDITRTYVLGDIVTPAEMLAITHEIPEENKNFIRETAQSSLTPAALI